jgi:hypothetical protein
MKLLAKLGRGLRREIATCCLRFESAKKKLCGEKLYKKEVGAPGLKPAPTSSSSVRARKGDGMLEANVGPDGITSPM